jgi:hypothetical protein
MKLVSASLAAAIAALATVGRVAATANPPVRDTPRPPAGKVVARISIPENSGGLAVGEGAVWSTSDAVSVLMKIDPTRNAVVATTKLPLQIRARSCREAAVRLQPGTVPCGSRVSPTMWSCASTPRRARSSPPWRSDPNQRASPHAGRDLGRRQGWPSVSRIDPATNQVVATIRLQGHRSKDEQWGSADSRSHRPIGLALGFGSLSVADLDLKTTDRVNERTGRIVGRLRVGGFPVRLGVGFGSVWVRDDTGRVLRIKPQE